MTTETLQRPGKEAAGSRHEPGVGGQAATAATEAIGPPTEALMEQILDRENLRNALQRVQANNGAPGVDGMTVDELPLAAIETGTEVGQKGEGSDTSDYPAGAGS